MLLSRIGTSPVRVDLHLIDHNRLLVVCQDLLELLDTDIGDPNVLDKPVIDTSLQSLPCALQHANLSSITFLTALPCI